MSVRRVGNIYHYRFMHQGHVVRRSTKQRNYRTATEMESAHLTALSKGDAGLGEKPKAPTLVPTGVKAEVVAQQTRQEWRR